MFFIAQPHIDILDLLDLGIYRDRCEIYINEHGIVQYNEKASFKSGFRRHYKTEEFCRQIGMSGEETVFWLLKYGEFLPAFPDRL